MIFIGKIFKKAIALYQQLRDEIDNWQTTIHYSLRFVLCGIFTFFAFWILGNLSKIDPVKLNTMLEHLFEPLPLFLTFYMIILGYIGFGFSVIAASLFKSLLPRTTQST